MKDIVIPLPSLNPEVGDIAQELGALCAKLSLAPMPSSKGQKDLLKGYYKGTIGNVGHPKPPTLRQIA